MDIQDKSQKNKEQSLDEKQEKQGISEQDDPAKTSKERDEYLEGWKRAKADLINYKKEEARRFESIIKFSNEALLKDLLIILDSFDLAISSSNEDSKTQKGLVLIKGQLEDVLRKSGLEKIKVEIGDNFNPELHEAFAKVESEQEPDTIVEEVESGFILNGKVVRPTKVKVAK